MALSIKTNFKNFAPVYNSVFTVASSTNSGNTNFKYVFRVYITGVLSYKQYEVNPDAEKQFGVLDISDYLQAFVSANLGSHDSTSSFTPSSGSIIKYRVDYFEQWDIAGVPTISVASKITGSDFYTFEASFNYADWIDWNYLLFTDYNGTNVFRFLTNWNHKRVSINNLGWSYFLASNPIDVDYMQVKTYDGNGDLIGTYRANNTISAASVEARMQKIPTSPKSLNKIATLALGAQPIISNSVKSYTVQVFESTRPITETLYFYLDEPCRYEMYTLHWENNYGAFDSFNFKGRNKQAQDVERSSMKINEYRLDNNGIQFRHQDKSNVLNWTKRTNKLILRSDYLTTDEHNNLKELIHSNEIYLEFKDGKGDINFKSIHQVAARSWEEKVVEIDKLFVMDIEVDLGQEAYSQRK